MVALETMLAIGALVGSAGLNIFGQSQRSKERARDRFWDIQDNTKMLGAQVSQTAETLRTKMTQQSAVSDLAPTGLESINMWERSQQNRLQLGEAEKLMSLRGSSNKKYRNLGFKMFGQVANTINSQQASRGPSFPSLGSPKNVAVD